MKQFILAIFATVVLVTSITAANTYSVVPDWLKLPTGREQLETSTATSRSARLARCRQRAGFSGGVAGLLARGRIPCATCPALRVTFTAS